MIGCSQAAVHILFSILRHNFLFFKFEEKSVNGLA